MMQKTKKGVNVLSSQNEENRGNYLFSENEKRAYIYGFVSLTRADASFCRKGHLMVPISQNKASRGNFLFSSKTINNVRGAI